MSKQGLKIEDVKGWVLVGRHEELHMDDSKTVHWHIAWSYPFSTRKSALAFAKENRWPGPYRAIRGRITVE